jgi:hypothetical protein
VPTIRITDTELTRDPRGILAQVQAGTEVIVEANHRPVAIIRPPRRSGRRLSDILADAARRPSTITLDAAFADDLQAVIARHREPWTPPSWE